MQITAKFETTCPSCGTKIVAGSRVNWQHGAKATHLECTPAAPSALHVARATYYARQRNDGYIRNERPQATRLTNYERAHPLTGI